MLKIDLHTHSVASPDGGITEKEYTKIITKKIVDYIAITDHNRIDFAQKLHEELGDAIIVGEEISTKNGEVIGLFLKEKIFPRQSLAKVIVAIHAQGGLVYIPHPFDRARHGIGRKCLLKHREEIDIIEGFNARVVWRPQNTKAREFAIAYHLPYGVGSDAHGKKGIQCGYIESAEPFTRESAKRVLQNARFVMRYQPWYGYLMPKWNRIKRIINL